MIELKNVGKVYSNGTEALRNINLNIDKGRIIGVIGRNGAGKSTLFKVMCGIITDYTGESRVLGDKSNIRLSDKVSYLPEVRGIDGRKTVGEHLTDLLMYKGYNRRFAEKLILQGLERFGMKDYRYFKINTLSKGNQQKLQVILTIANAPEILILDEPFSGLDLITAEFLWKIICELKENGSTILFSSHNLSDIIYDSDAFVFLDKGNLQEFGTLEEIQSHYDMILEIQNDSLREEVLGEINGVDGFRKEGDVYYVSMKEEDTARAIYQQLDNKYSRRFYVRKMTLSEIFKSINR